MKALLVAITRWFCRPLKVSGRERLPQQPVVFVANHSSHADTAVVLTALPRRVRRSLAPAAAEDYWFSTKFKGRVARSLTGAFPFPRRGSAGLERARELLTQGRSVLLFPEGTRSTDGAVREFKSGIGILATQGAVIVPLGIAGTPDVFPKGAKWPQRSGVAVVVGPARAFDPGLAPDVIAKQLQHEVCDLAARARKLRRPPRPSVFERVSRFARSRAALWLVFGWSVAEAMWWPVIPDFLVAPLALAAPGRFLVLAGTATAGSVLGGAAAFSLGAPGDWLAGNAPLLTPPMHEQAVAWMTDGGFGGLLQQPLSGVPYKVFALHGAEAGLALPGFIAMSVAVRGLRMGAVAAIFAVGGRFMPRIWPRIFGAFLIGYCIVFAFGLHATVESWR